MSSEQQDAILGRVLREHAETKKNLAALCSEAEKVGNYLTALGHALRKNHSLDASDFSATEGFMDLGLLPTQGVIRDLVAQIREAKSRKQQLASRLRDAGYEPKE